MKILGFKILTPRERMIYNARLKGLPLRQIGNNFGVSGERIRQIEAQILRKLHKFDNPTPYGNLSVRAENCLRTAGIKSLKEARKTDSYKLLCIKNIGKKTLVEIKAFAPSTRRVKRCVIS